jgi:hypothetical protein
MARRIHMKSIGLSMAGLLILGKQGYSYPPNQSFPEEMFVFPEIALFLMLGLRIVLLIVGRVRICRPLTLSPGPARGDMAGESPAIALNQQRKSVVMVLTGRICPREKSGQSVYGC